MAHVLVMAAESWQSLLDQLTLENTVAAIRFAAARVSQAFDLDTTDEGLSAATSAITCSQYRQQLYTTLTLFFDGTKSLLTCCIPLWNLLVILSLRNLEIVITLLLLAAFVVGKSIVALYFRATDAVAKYFRRIQRRMHARFNEWIQRYGPIVKLLPPALYVAAMTAAFLYSPSLRNVSQNYNIFAIFAFVYPWVFSFACLIPLEGELAADTEIQNRVKLSTTQWSQYWAALALPHVIGHLPFLGGFLKGFALWGYLRLAYLLWLYLPFGYGSSAVLSYFTTGLRQIFPLLAPAESQLEKTVGMLDYIPSLVLSERSKQAIRHLFAGGYASFFGIAFFFSPRFIEAFGCEFVGALLPAINVCSGNHKLWLRYTIVYLPLLFLHYVLSNQLSSLPFWYTGKMAATLWLQLPAFGGASQLFQELFQMEKMVNLVDIFSPARDVIRRRNFREASLLRLRNPFASPQSTPLRGKIDDSLTSRRDHEENALRRRTPRSNLSFSEGISALSPLQEAAALDRLEEETDELQCEGDPGENVIAEAKQDESTTEERKTN